MKPNVFLVATIEGIKPEGDFDASDQIDKYHYTTNEPSVITERLESAPQGFRKGFADKEKPFDNYFRDLMFGAFPSAVGATSL